MSAPSGRANFNDSLPAPPTGRVNGKFQLDNTVDPGNASFNVHNIGGVDPRTTTTETIGQSSSGMLVTLTNAAAVAVSLDSTVPADFLCWAKMTGAGAGTLTPTAGATINGGANLPLASGAQCLLFWTGTTWWALFTDTSGFATKAGVQLESYTYAADTGAANAYAVSLSPAPAAYAAGLEVVFNAAHANTGASTLNVNGLGAKTIKKFSSGSLVDLASGDISAGQIMTVKYDGTYFQIVSGSGGGGSGFTAGGDLSGTSSSQEVIGILNKAIDGTAPTDGQILQYSNSTGKWEMLVDRPIFPVSAVVGKPSAGQLVCIYTAAASMTFPANFAAPNSYGSVGTNPTATATYSVYKNGSLIGNVAVSTSGVFTFTTVGGASFNLNAGDRLTIVAPGSQDATMADVGITLVGTRTATVPSVLGQGIFIWRGTYSGATAYSINDVVAYAVSGKVQTYICILGTTGNAPTNTTYWNLVAQAGADGAAGGVQIGADLGGTNTAPTVISTHLSSPLPVAQGGTGDATLTAHGVLVGAGTSAVNATGAGTAGQVLTSNGASADPTFQAAAGGGLPALFGGSNKRWEGIWRSGSSTEKPLNGVDNANSPSWVAATTSLPPYVVNWGGGYVEGQLALLTGKNIHWYLNGWIQSTSSSIGWTAGIGDANSNSGGGVASPSGKYAFFRYVHGTDTNFKCITSDGTTQTIVDSGIAVDTAIHTFEIQFSDSTPNVVFSIDGSVVATITTHLPGNGVLVRRGWYVAGGSNTTAFAEAGFYVQQDPTWP